MLDYDMDKRATITEVVQILQDLKEKDAT